MIVIFSDNCLWLFHKWPVMSYYYLVNSLYNSQVQFVFTSQENTRLGTPEELRDQK